jgi:hypothetical protein
MLIAALAHLIGSYPPFIDLHTGAVILKSVRFRVEFSPVLGYTAANQSTSHTRRQSSSHVSTSTQSSSATPNLSQLPPPSTIPMSPRASAAATRLGAKNLAPFASTLVLVQEKGALSTFKYVYQRLRSEWRLDTPLRSPDLGGATPMVMSATPRVR